MAAAAFAARGKVEIHVSRELLPLKLGGTLVELRKHVEEIFGQYEVPLSPREGHGPSDVACAVLVEELNCSVAKSELEYVLHRCGMSKSVVGVLVFTTKIAAFRLKQFKAGVAQLSRHEFHEALAQGATTALYEQCAAQHARDTTFSFPIEDPTLSRLLNQLGDAIGGLILQWRQEPRGPSVIEQLLIQLSVFALDPDLAHQLYYVVDTLKTALEVVALTAVELKGVSEPWVDVRRKFCNAFCVEMELLQRTAAMTRTEPLELFLSLFQCAEFLIESCDHKTLVKHTFRFQAGIQCALQLTNVAHDRDIDHPNPCVSKLMSSHMDVLLLALHNSGAKSYKSGTRQRTYMEQCAGFSHVDRPLRKVSALLDLLSTRKLLGQTETMSQAYDQVERDYDLVGDQKVRLGRYLHLALFREVKNSSAFGTCCTDANRERLSDARAAADEMAAQLLAEEVAHKEREGNRALKKARKRAAKKEKLAEAAVATFEALEIEAKATEAEAKALETKATEAKAKAKAVADADDACVVCMEAKRCVAVVPCGHRVLCEACSQRAMTLCPMCRVPVTSLLKIFD